MWFQKHWVALCGLSLTALFIYLQLLQWQRHGDDFMLTAATIIVTGLLWIVLVVAIFRYWRDSKQAESRQAAVDNASAQKIVKLEAEEKRLIGEVADLAATVKGEQQDNQRLREVVQKGVDYGNAQAAKLAELIPEWEHLKGEVNTLNAAMEALKQEHEKAITDERQIVVHDAKWGIGGMYSVDATVFVKLFVRSGQKVTASEEN